MYYSIICYDHNNSSEKRKKLRPKHINYLTKNKNLILFAGPIMDDEDMIIGSLIVINFENKNQVEIFSKNDPYYLGGLFKKVLINKFKKVF
tara:strand:+ start:80 stop:352 length:273 start_codon:yes stop_codon:yes gene_type:complete